MSAISIRHVLFGPGLPIDERLTYVAALLFGVSLASALGLCMGFCMKWLESMASDAVSIAGVVASLRETSIPQDASLAIGEQRAHLVRERVLVPFLPLAQLLEAQRRVIKRTKLGAGALAHG